MRAGGAECRQGELHRTTAQEDKEAQFRSAANGLAQGRTANGADCNTNNPTSLKEAHVDHSEGGMCVTSVQGGVQTIEAMTMEAITIEAITIQGMTI